MKTKEITQNPILDLRKRYDGRVRWGMFMEFAIPDKAEREQFKHYIRNAIYGIRNKKALILYGPGANGKSTITRVLSEIIDNSCFMLNISPTMHGESFVFLEGVTKRDIPYIKLMLDNAGIFSVPQRPSLFSAPSMEWPDIVMVVNEMPTEGLLRRSILINMPNTPIVANPSMAEELLEGRCGILDWFL